MDFVSVERIVELLHVEQEPAGTVAPPAWWPSYTGSIIFEDVTIRYSPHLDHWTNWFWEEHFSVSASCHEYVSNIKD